VRLLMPGQGEFAQNDKQTEIMKLVMDTARDTGDFIELHELKGKLSYGPDVSKQAILCSLKFLEKHGLIAREHRKRKLYIKPTLEAFKVFVS
jgi:hypothetical protein